jgi:diaminopimelate decarboxylase
MTPTNINLVQLSQKFGTPLYVYHAEKIKEQYQKLTTAFQQIDARFFYACKALTNINIIKYVHSLGCNIDCSSINEVKLALHINVPPQNILYTSNGIAFEEIAEAVQLGVHVNIDSISNLQKFGKKFGNTYPVGIRVRPNIMAGGNIKISTGHDTSKFGIPIDQIEEVLQIVNQHNIFIKTIHIHTGSDIKDANVFVNGLKVLHQLIPLFPQLQIIDLGGGFKVPYAPNEKETDLNKIAEKLKEFIETEINTDNRKIQIWFEPGKFLVSEAGILLTKVNVLKKTPTIEFAGIDTGLNHLIRPMMYDAYHFITNCTNPNSASKTYTVTGNICETDTFASNREIAQINEGDILAIHNAGAYGFEMASNYNSRYKPGEVLLLNGVAKLIRHRDTFEDLLKNQIDIS